MSEYEKILVTLVTITTQIKLYHWQTLSHPRHVASGDLYSVLDDLVDKFIEALHGRLIIESGNSNTRILLSERMNKITLKNYNDAEAVKLIKYVKTYLESDELNAVIGKSTDLLNIRDEMLAAINKSGYLFSLN
jgi:hypothetical protein